MANIKDIVMNGEKNFPCRISTTADQAVNTIRSTYNLTGGCLQDDGGPLTDGAALIGTTFGVLSFVYGQEIFQMRQGNVLYFYILYQVKCCLSN
jgi:hypothetical protein